jgi:hypothetical protein
MHAFFKYFERIVMMLVKMVIPTAEAASLLKQEKIKPTKPGSII